MTNPYLPIEKPTIYLCGYGLGNRAYTLQREAERLNALVIDIREHRLASEVEWRGTEIESILTMKRYYHVPEWAEKWNGEEFGVKDFKAGAERLRKHLANYCEFGKPIRFDAYIILCRCRNESLCGKGWLGKKLHEKFGYTIRPFVWRPEKVGVAEAIETEKEFALR